MGPRMPPQLQWLTLMGVREPLRSPIQGGIPIQAIIAKNMSFMVARVRPSSFWMSIVLSRQALEHGALPPMQLILETVPKFRSFEGEVV